MIPVLNCLKTWPARYWHFFSKTGLDYLLPGSRLLILLAVLLAFPISTFAQEKCGAVLYQEYLKSKGIKLPETQKFEDWLRKKRIEKKLNQPLGVEKITQSIYTIPVVVHIIHNGEPIGTATNIPDQQIISQIEVLNEDFRRQNLDAILTPAEFLPVAADPEIEFVMAKQDPDGLATNGITRTEGTKTSYSFADAELIKGFSYWPAEDYLNIWVAKLSGGLVGLGSFPITDLEGIVDPELNRLYDGVIVAYDAFGSADKYPSASFRLNIDKGRTTTHEVGHFLGLRHISGDGGCSVDDFCLDTPSQDGQTTGCPNGRNTCSSNDMYQNYMDYTDDRCMNIFTDCQKGRMRIVLENSPRRLSLLSSHALQEPVPISLDLSISEILAPSSGECSQSITPVLQIRNAGTDVITEAILKVSANGLELETKTFALNLANGESADITFSPALMPSQGSYSFDFEVQLVNGVADINTKNNTKSIDSFISFDLSLPAIETFGAIPASWNLINIDDDISWETGNAPALATSNTAARLRFYDYAGGVGQQDYLITPLLDLSGSTSATLIFSRAYAKYPAIETDNLKVAVSLDCGNSFPFIVYNQSSSGLQTALPTSLPFIPTSQDDWFEERVDLSAFSGLTDLQIAFIGTNGFGNNLYIDNLKIIKTPLADVGISRIITPDRITCNSTSTPSVLVTNSGTVTLNNLSVSVSADGIPISNKNFSGLNLTAGNQTTLNLDPITLKPGNNQLTFDLSLSPGTADFDPEDNTLTADFVVVPETEFIPLRLNFEAGFDNWIVSGSETGPDWQVEEIINEVPNNQAASVRSWNSLDIGSRSLLVSPVLNFSLAREASLLFEVSHASRADKNDQLRIKVSTDCGNSFDLLYEKGSENLDIITTEEEWFPQSASDWLDQYLNLTAFVGQEEVIIAFEYTNGGGNNFFLDDIELYLSSDATPIDISQKWLIYPNPALTGIFNITLNLDNKQQTTVSILNSLGRELYKTIILNSLNQTIPVDLSTQASGVYFVRLTSGELNETRRVIIKP